MLENLGTFNFNGKSSDEFGLFVKSKNIRKSPAADVSIISVPGRSGDVVLDNKRYPNIDITYSMRTNQLTSENCTKIAEWLGVAGYKYLTDSFDVSTYRKAICTSGQEWAELSGNWGDIDITFNCDPFKYLLSGANQKNISGETIITNPTNFNSLPNFLIYSTGDITLHIGARSYLISDTSGQFSISSENQQIYNSSGSLASHADFDNFPVLYPGNNTISYTGSNVTYVIITPNWRRL